MFPDLRSYLYASQILSLGLLRIHTLLQRNTGGKMRIKQITATSVRIPYAAPGGLYLGRRSVGGHGTLGAAGLIVKIEADSGIIG